MAKLELLCLILSLLGTARTASNCSSNPCSNGGTCVEYGPGNITCVCVPGFSGLFCEGAFCTSNPCLNGGSCLPVQSGYTCTCTKGFIGVNCSKPADPCQPNPCMNGGTCRPATEPSYVCECPVGTRGEHCQDMDPCQPNPCKNGGTCQAQPQAVYQCSCPQSVTGNNCQNTGETNAGYSTVIIAVGVSVGVLIVALLIALFYLLKRSRSVRGRRKSPTAERSRELERQASFNNYISGVHRGTETSLTSSVKSREFPRDKLHLLNQVGSGSFAVVYKAIARGIIDKASDTTVAVKMLKDSATPSDKSDFKKELKLYSTLDRHPNVLCMLGCCTDKDPMYIILEYVPHGNLQSYLRHIRTGMEPMYLDKPEFNKRYLSPQEILNFACQIVRGMEYLAAKQCIHRDLATRNILLGEGFICKVSDFGLARDITEGNQYEMQSQGRVPVRWMALESLINNMYTTKSDVWSFGVLLWELVTLGSHPYPGMSSQKVISELKKGYRLPKPDHCSPDIYKVMTDCWQERPDARPDFAQLHMKLDDLLADATGYLEMASLNPDDYTYLEPGQPTSTDSD